jgi:putative oxidoreductase
MNPTSIRDCQRSLFAFEINARSLPVKIAATIARYLLGLMFLAAGVMKFIPVNSGPLPPGAAGEFMGALMATKYIWIVGAFEIAGGVPLLINRYVPMGLSLLAPIIVNILAVSILMDHRGLPAGLAASILWILVFVRVNSAFDGIFAPTGQR